MSETMFFKDKSIINQDSVCYLDDDRQEHEGISIITDGSEVIIGVSELIKAIEWHGYTVISQKDR